MHIGSADTSVTDIVTSEDPSECALTPLASNHFRGLIDDRFLDGGSTNVPRTSLCIGPSPRTLRGMVHAAAKPWLLG